MGKSLDKIRKIIGSKLTLEEAMQLQDELEEKIEEKKEGIVKENVADTESKKDEGQEEKVEQNEAISEEKEVTNVEIITQEMYENALKRIKELEEAKTKAVDSTSMESQDSGASKTRGGSTENINKL